MGIALKCGVAVDSFQSARSAEQTNARASENMRSSGVMRRARSLAISFVFFHALRAQTTAMEARLFFVLS